MLTFTFILAVMTAKVPFATAQKAHGEEASKKMGPVAFMWPPDREWGAAHDNTAPCGSHQGVTNRTDFPLINGAIALVIQDNSSNIHISVSYKDEPRSSDDFVALPEPKQIDKLDPGHGCYPLPPPPRDIEDGSNATIQLKYLSEFDSNRTETFYACADIRYVSASKFKTQVPCFNATKGEFGGHPKAKPSGTPSPSNPSPASKAANGLSDGAIAGITLGVVGGLALFVMAILGYRRYEQKRRIRLTDASIRKVNWGGNAS
ncbi:hypothetical protein LOZ57_001824 [Ophidiomyces ophidiicola]|uniref:uncharacterized protein n=1 Tax=Ophidiomyces ophidiicola TaxID=1387563 RepID=UPI0020C3645F|nr:uncharacterized protein LOZ57_001824 [Ophidiomyces ophidiicola]KAI1951269.1 hypothetical protein LOZ57_001824 [Ophidiomyces ophidiicola]KAI2060714.1 hypothetical protein LOZ43_001539 [Ophidiomyces ophidiicola]KAI2090260.1 hypothetical protein LOZ36_001472 [Ophidiomyces ophidiicola]